MFVIIEENLCDRLIIKTKEKKEKKSGRTFNASRVGSNLQEEMGKLNRSSFNQSTRFLLRTVVRISAWKCHFCFRKWLKLSLILPEGAGLFSRPLSFFSSLVTSLTAIRQCANKLHIQLQTLLNAGNLV